MNTMKTAVALALREQRLECAKSAKNKLTADRSTTELRWINHYVLYVRRQYRQARKVSARFAGWGLTVQGRGFGAGRGLGEGMGLGAAVAVGVGVAPPVTSRNAAPTGPHVWKPWKSLTPRPRTKITWRPTDRLAVFMVASTATVGELNAPFIGMAVPPAQGGVSM